MYVERVDFISIPTRDVVRAIGWYRDVLGLPESGVSEGELETPNVTLSFWEPERDDLPFAPNQAGFAIRVSDVAAARAELETKGVEFIAETWDSGVCHFAALRDPDGNTIILHRRYAPRIPREGGDVRLRQRSPISHERARTPAIEEEGSPQQARL